MMTKEEKLAWNKQAYGDPYWDEVPPGGKESNMAHALSFVSGLGGAKMLAMSILSDAQEVNEMGHKETVRQMINKAKRVIEEIPTK